MTRIRDWILANLLIILASLAALFGVVAVVQTVRLDGFQIDAPLVGEFGPEGWIAKAERLEADNLAIIAAQGEAEEMHLLELARIENERRRKAEEADDARKKLQDAQLVLARRFIAAGGVRPQADRNPTPQTAPGTQGGAAGRTDGEGGVPLVDGLFVTVRAEDVEICTVNTSRLMAAHAWAVDLNQ